MIKKLLPRLKKDETNKLLEISDLSTLVRKEVTAPLGDQTIEETVDFLHASGEVHANLSINGSL